MGDLPRKANEAADLVDESMMRKKITNSRREGRSCSSAGGGYGMAIQKRCGTIGSMNDDATIG